MMRDSDGVHDEALRQVARRLGAGAADRLDVEQTAQAVVARLRAGDAPARPPIRWTQPAWMRAAAGVVLIIGAGLLVYWRLRHPAPETVAAPSVVVASIDPDLAVTEFPEFTSGQLRDVLNGLDSTVEITPTVHAGEAGVEDLSEPQLQSLLKAMED
ncbi:MAG TPA: hypothetical protein VNG35_05925 [Gemmatimonadales bacterium]|nr:hypothetical protein [Gemmatimonadales bacterium]